MRIFKKAAFISLVVLLLVAVPVLAAPYFGLLLLQETDGNSYTQAPFIFSVNNTNLVTQGFMNSSGNDTRVTSGGANLPRMIADDKTLVVTDLPANTNKTLIYTMGSDNETTSMPVIVGPSGNVTVADNATIELGDNSTVLVDGWWNTDNGTGKNAVYKDASFRLYVSPIVSGNITAGINSLTGWLHPTSHNDPGGEWANETNAYDDNLATYSERAALAAGAWSDYLELSRGLIVSGKLRYYYTFNAAQPQNIDIEAYYDGGWQNVFTGAPGAVNTWHEKSFSDNETISSIRFRFQGHAVNPGDIYLKEVEFNGTDADLISVTASAIASGEHLVEVDNPHNILVNGNFESGNPPDDWAVTRATIAQDSITKYTGAYSVNITSTAQFAFTSQAISNYADYKGQTLTVGFWYLAPSINDQPQKISITLGAVGETTGASFIQDDAWHWFTYSRLIDPASTSIRIAFYANFSANVDAGEILYIDGAVYIIGATVPDGGNFSISVDGVVKDATFTDNTTPVPDNSNAWAMMQNDVLSYADNTSITVNGTQSLYFAPVTIIEGTTLPDRALSNTGNITWGSNPSGVSANFTSFGPVSEAQAPAFALGEAPLFITTAPNISSNFTVTPGTGTGTFPLAAVITSVATATSTPSQLPLLIIAGFVILAASLCASSIFRQHGSGTIFVKILVIAAFMGIFVALKNFGIDFWMLMVFLMISTAIAMASKQLGWT